mmetsp:Transcript_5722/g.9401  ORF Transcript_5722/g.9401 Transcript_5722/m.9401 type:complete len:98 (-) Transcript_5722:574-867(-)
MIGKLVNWIVNELIVHNLANNRRFQTFAVRIDSMINKNKKILNEEVFSKQNIESVTDNIRNVQKGVKDSETASFMRNFMTEFRKEIAEDMKKMKTKK